LLILVIGSSCSTTPQRREILPTVSQIALKNAFTRLGSKYVWSSNGPATFDCSGLIVWSYQQATGKKMIFTDGERELFDANIEWLLLHNTVEIHDPENLRPGDLVFIADATDRIVHGGLFVDRNGDMVRFIHSSYFHGKVVLDEWYLTGKVRDQYIKAFGRILLGPAFH